MKQLELIILSVFGAITNDILLPLGPLVSDGAVAASSICLVTNHQKRQRAESLSNVFPETIKSSAHEPAG